MAVTLTQRSLGNVASAYRLLIKTTNFSDYFNYAFCLHQFELNLTFDRMQRFSTCYMILSGRIVKHNLIF